LFLNSFCIYFKFYQVIFWFSAAFWLVFRAVQQKPVALRFMSCFANLLLFNTFKSTYVCVGVVVLICCGTSGGRSYAAATLDWP